MAKMPGVMVEGPWSPEDDAEAARKARAYKPEMAEVKPPPGPVFSGPDDSAPATFIEPSRPSLWERTKEHFNYQVNHGFFALGDLMEMRLQRLNAEEKQAELAKMQAEGQGDTMAAKRTEMEMFQSAGESEMARTARAEDTFRFENMPAAEGVLENAAAVVGGFAGSIDPTVIVPEAKIGTTAWRMGSPVISKMLDYGVSNAAMNALLNASVQAGELGADIRDEIDWDSVLLDAGVGAAMGVPFGYIHGRAARDEMAQLVQAPEPGMAPWAPPRTGPRVENVPKPERVPDQTTVESISEAHAPEEITAAQETLFGEVVGTRNLTPEQLNQVDDYINAGKPYGEEFPRETTVQDMPPVREPAQSEAEPLPQVPERGQPEGSANPPPANEGPERAKGVPPSATYVGLNADGNQVWEWQHKDGPRRIEVRPGKSVSMENPSMLSGPGFTPYVRDARFEVATPAQSPKAPEPAPLAGGYQDFRPADLKVDASRFQFKGGGDEEGVVETLKKVKTWDRKKSGTIIVWQDLAGNNYVVDGHQRYGLAKRLKAEGQDPVLHAMIWREADGISAEDAKVLAADINISQGSGTAVDAAKILRSRPEMMDNLPKNAVTEHGVGLAKLSDDAFGMIVNGKVPPEYGALVGRLAPTPSTHAQILDVLAKNEPASAAQAESMIRDVLSAPEVEQTMADMFGSAEVTQILFKERAQVLSSAATALRKDRAAFNTLVKEEARLTGAGNKLATATNLERAQTDAEILATLQATARRKGPVADALAAAAKSLHDGTPRQVAVREFLDRIRGEVKGASPDGAGLPSSPQSIAASLGGYRNTDTPAFGRWFGDSKVVDENGDPLLLHHGTNENGIDSFNTQRIAWFTPEKDLSQQYAKERWFRKGGEQTVYPVYVKAENPLKISLDMNSRATLDEIRSAIGFDYMAGDKGWEDDAETVMHRFYVMEIVASEKFRDAAKAAGYDSIFVNEGGVPTIGVFSPTQIKSIYNRGTWDAQDPRISFSAPAGKTYTYAPKYRPPGYATVPPGFTSIGPPTKEHPFGTVTYDKPITFKDEDAFELTPLDPRHPRNLAKARDEFVKKFRTKFEQTNGRYTAEMTVKGAEGQTLKKQIIVTPSTSKGVDWQLTYLTDGEPSGHLEFNDFDQLAQEVWLFSKQGYEPPPQFAFSAPRQAGPGLFDVGADKKPQAVLPGAERIGDKSLAERRAAAPLKPTKPQKSLDFGLFGDSGDQLDLVDLSRTGKDQGTLFMVKQDADYLDFSPSGTARNAIVGKASITYAPRDGEVEIISFRVPTEFRRQGEGREAMMAFLDKADEEGLAVRAYSTPLDRSTDREGIIRFYEGLGFTATGRKINAAGDIEMLRSGPPPEVAELRQLVGQGRLIPLRDYTDPAMAQQVSQTFYNAQPSRPLDALYEGGILQKNQDRLGRVGDEIAQITGAKFKNPGLKKKETAQQKMIRKRYKGTNRLADLVRAGFLVDTPDQAQKVVNLLAQNFRVLDEGWAVLAEGYFDRKVMVQFADGTIGEVQIWEPSLLKAKMEGGGHELYTAARDLPPGPEKAALQKKMEDLYYPLLDALDPSWGATVGREGKMPNVRENSSRMASSEASNLPESPTSAESTSSQSAPGSSTAQAKPLSETAGRPSQSTNFMESSILGEDTGAGRASQGSKPSQEWRTVEIVAQTETGETVKLPAGEAVDYMLSRIKAARELLDCVNAG